MMKNVLGFFIAAAASSVALITCCVPLSVTSLNSRFILSGRNALQKIASVCNIEQNSWFIVEMNLNFGRLETFSYVVNMQKKASIQCSKPLRLLKTPPAEFWMSDYSIFSVLSFFFGLIGRTKTIEYSFPRRDKKCVNKKFVFDLSQSKIYHLELLFSLARLALTRSRVKFKIWKPCEAKVLSWACIESKTDLKISKLHKEHAKTFLLQRSTLWTRYLSHQVEKKSKRQKVTQSDKL